MTCIYKQSNIKEIYRKVTEEQNLNPSHVFSPYALIYTRHGAITQTGKVDKSMSRYKQGGVLGRLLSYQTQTMRSCVNRNVEEGEGYG